MNSQFASPLQWVTKDKQIIVVANREPYIHEHRNNQIEIIRPASGLVAALEPIVRECSGLWIAHGSGSADQDVTQKNGEIAVPPENPNYTLKRLWLSESEEEGYYYGFANEGLWPLCHLAHQRPSFRLKDWEYYTSVNLRFSDAIPTVDLNHQSFILIQDYHFALLPRLVKNKTPLSRVCLFWHIPWPSPEAFGICPWYKELLFGMLGADLIGFHTQNHCNNFLETCDKYLEARVDWEKFSVTMENHETLIRAFPIGIHTAPVKTLSPEERKNLKLNYGLHSKFIAVGVDRIDYTKGLLERIDAVDRFLEKYPQYQGNFTLAQMGAPSRTHISTYQSLNLEIQKSVDRVNLKYSQIGHKNSPIVFLPTHHDWKEIQFFYQLGDLCLVTSLHDGMNLVAKEYVWCQSAQLGSLILSRFAGASRELTEAFIINPYSTEEVADAIAACLSMSPLERIKRMNLMKEKVQKQNAFKWANDIIHSLVSGTSLAVPPH